MPLLLTGGISVASAIAAPRACQGLELTMNDLYDDFANTDADDFDFRELLPADTVIEQFLQLVEA